MAAERSAGRPARRTPVWARPRVAGRGPQPSLTLPAIVAAAVAVADAEGVDAVSMRRIATELGVGTMSLYRYVETKDDLLDLMADQVFGEGGSGRGHLDDWRADLHRFAVGYRDLLLRHPWLLPVGLSRPPLGPNVLRRTEWLLGCLDGRGLGIDEMAGLTGVVVAYVRGVALAEIAEAEAARRTGRSQDDYRRLVGPYLTDVFAAGQHPLMARFVAEADDRPDPDRVFRRGLERVLDGVAAALAAAADDRTGSGSGSGADSGSGSGSGSGPGEGSGTGG
ncbi:TetR/AcrR family transcriptional regulator [Streptacidiphilus sp. PB12-B1b]|uniref:TetR/AcrR family transcriptional regulator n=1 Tax=Streptacidiphilus sp. PB12-B1b TaxID=2705012 RepID=UPI0015FCA378|nr:TetR/AcrR family transcriptional regulator [Streptacidiphilus sp. PB12-B1b]QMU75383.1 TetR/AcrR family transcriptional regulator [Streptacidiphilus sp. PB12-B1b]